MSKKGYSVENIWGGYDHYDEHGKKIGSSSPNIWGGFNEYDAKGKRSVIPRPISGADIIIMTLVERKPAVPSRIF